MEQCHVCGFGEFRDEIVSEIFQIDSKPALVENIPARVCVRCGEYTFSRQTTEKVRRMVYGEAHPIRSINMDVFAYS